MDPWLRLLIASMLIAANGFLVTAEFALVRSRSSRLEVLRRRGSRRAEAALRLVRELVPTLAITQIGITLANLGIGWLGEPAVAALLESSLGSISEWAYVRPLSFLLGFLAITLATVILGELVPKAIGIQRAEPVLVFTAGPLLVLGRILFPLVAVTNRLASAVLRIIGLQSAFGEETGHTEEDLRAILSRSHERGQITRVGRDILERVLGFARLNARQLMVPRPDVVWLSTRRSVAENFEIAHGSGYTRFPYCDGDLDRVLGVVHIKDLAGGEGAVDPTGVMRPPLVVPETATADRLLRVFQKSKVHLAIVVDEYGGTSGVVTLEDVMEEIVGDVQDEFDQEPPEIVALEHGAYRIEGKARFREAARKLGADPSLAAAEVDTVAGYVQDRLGRLARVGDAVRFGAYDLRVEEVRGNRIVRLTAQPASPLTPPARR